MFNVIEFCLMNFQIVVVVVFIEVCFEDKFEFFKFVFIIKDGFMDKYEFVRRQWGGGIMGFKVNMCIEKKCKVFEVVIKI